MSRGPEEPFSSEIGQFYGSSSSMLAKAGSGRRRVAMLECTPAWEGNWTWDCFISFALRGPDGRLLVCVVNYAPNSSQCYLHVPLVTEKEMVEFRDIMSPATYSRYTAEVLAHGLYLDMPAWGYHIFEVAIVDN